MCGTFFICMLPPPARFLWCHGLSQFQKRGFLSLFLSFFLSLFPLLKATSTPSSKSLTYKKEKKTSSSPIMWYRYAKRTIGWLSPSSSRCKDVRGQPQKDRGRTSGTMCTCEEIERGTHAHRASKLGPVERWWTSAGNWVSQSKTCDTPPRVRKTDTFIVFYLFVLFSVTCLKTCDFTACFTSLWTSISVFYVNTARDVTSSRFCL